ncbi:hypothetical protein FQZ97_798580 [compost metagenome]
MVDPCVKQARLPSTMPKQWYSGTGMHRRSAGVSFMHSPMKKPLFRILRWVSVAPLGKPVVPLVNWMLIGSLALSVAATCATRGSAGSPRASSAEKRIRPASSAPCPASSIQTTVFRCGSCCASSAPGWPCDHSGASSRSMPR